MQIGWGGFVDWTTSNAKRCIVTSYIFSPKYYSHILKYITLQNRGDLAATAAPRAEFCESALRGRTVRRWEHRRWRAGSRVLIAPKSWSSPPLLPPPPPDAMAGSVCLQPSRSVTEGPQAVKAVEAAVQVDDRGTADGECLEDALVKGKRGTKPLDRRHRAEWGPRLDGGSTSLIVASSGTPELTAAARHPRSRQRTSGLALY